MSDPRIDNALTKAYIAGGFNSVSTAYPNTTHSTTAGVDWNELFIIPSTSSQASLGVNGKDFETGIFQITLATEKGSGDGDILDRALAIKQYYQNNSVLSESGITVQVGAITINAGFTSDDWYKVPVSITYRAFITRGQ